MSRGPGTLTVIAYFPTREDLILADDIRVRPGLGDALHAAATRSVVNEAYAPVVAAVTVLLRACTGHGHLRDGLDPGDVLLLMGFLWRTPATDRGREQGRRLLDLTIETSAPADFRAAARFCPAAPLSAG